MKRPLSLFLQNRRNSASSLYDYQALADIIKSCSASFNTDLGKSLHCHAVKLGHGSCQLVSKSLLNFYAKCKKLDSCDKMFYHLSSHDTVTWNIFLSGYASSRAHDVRVMELFNLMHSIKEVDISSVTLAIVLPVIARNESLLSGKSVHCYGIKCGLEVHTLMGNALLSMYAKCGHVLDAYGVFSTINDKDVVSWNAMISGFVENKLVDEAFYLFQRMVKGNVGPNYATIVNAIPICASLKESDGYHFGKEIHGYVVRRAELAAEVTVVNAILSFYLRTGSMREAESLFWRMESRDLVTWNSIIAGFAFNGEWSTALEFFRILVCSEMIIPDCVTLISILPACAQLSNLQAGKQIHGFVVRHPGEFGDISVGNALISFYAKCGCPEAALLTFHFIPRRDLISWNSLLDAFQENEYKTQFINLFCRMFEDGIKPDSITILTVLKLFANPPVMNKVKEAHAFSLKSGLLLGDTEPTLGNAILDAYAKCGDMDYASKIFEILSEKRNLVTCNSMISGFVNCGSCDGANLIFKSMSHRDLTTWNLMVRAYAENECPDQALNLFLELQHCALKPDGMTIMSLLPVCAQMASTNMLRQCHGYVIRAGFEDAHLKGALLDVYSKCGCIESAVKLFSSTAQKDLVMFTAMVGGYAMHGMGEQALDIYSNMLSLHIKPDHVIITTVLSACSHVGLVDEGLVVFDSIKKVHQMEPSMEQYACVVDLLARGGRIKDAYSFVVQMPVKANANIWGTLLGACKTYLDVDIGRAVADHLLGAATSDIGSYVVMSNLYAANGRWDQVLEMRRLMKIRDLKKPAGCSWVEVEGQKNIFIAGDCSHPNRSSIYNILGYMDQQIKDIYYYE